MDHSVERILGAARDLLRETGKVTYRSIAERAGLSLGTITYYFPSRSAIVEALVDHHHGHALAEGRQAAVGSSAVRAVTASVRHALRERGVMRIHLGSFVGGWELPKVRRDAMVRAVDRVTREPWCADLPHWERRIIVQCMLLGVQQLAAMGDDDLCALTVAESPERAREHVEQALAHLAAHLSNS